MWIGPNIKRFGITLCMNLILMQMGILSWIKTKYAKMLHNSLRDDDIKYVSSAKSQNSVNSIQKVHVSEFLPFWLSMMIDFYEKGKIEHSNEIKDGENIFHLKLR